MALPNPWYASWIAINTVYLERSGTSARLTLSLTRFPDDGRANLCTFVTFQRKTHFAFHRRTVEFRTRNFYFKVTKQNVCHARKRVMQSLKFARNSNMTNCPKWPNLSSDRRSCMSRICFVVFCRKLRISTLTYCRHLDIGTHPPGMALPRTAQVRLDRLHIRLGRFRSCLHKWNIAPSASCDLWRRRTDRWPCCPSLSNPAAIDLCIAWRFWMTTMEWLLNTWPRSSAVNQWIGRTG